MRVAHAETVFRVGYQKVRLLPGQAVIGRLQGARDCGLTEKQFRGAIKRLEDGQKVTIKRASKYSLVTVVGWPFADDDESDEANKKTGTGPADGQVWATIKNINPENEKKEEKDGVANAPPPPPISPSATERKQPKTKTARFAPPMPEEVDAYCRIQGFVHVKGVRFCDYYGANGWILGKVKMACWKAAVRIWEFSDNGGESRRASAPAKQRVN